MTAAAALPMRHVERCMGTVFSIDVRAPGVSAATLATVVRWLHWVDATFSTYRDDSQISRLGQGAIALDDCVDEVREVLDACEVLSAATRGFFSAYPSGPLDPSGYVKGWAIERAAALLAEAGSANHCVNGGGDVQCAGSPRPGESWRIGIADPRSPSDLVGVATGSMLAVATSGTAERGAHILDPHTTRPVTELLSVTVVGERLSLVDAYATAAFAMGDRAQSWLASMGLPALVVAADGEVWSSLES